MQKRDPGSATEAAGSGVTPGGVTEAACKGAAPHRCETGEARSCTGGALARRGAVLMRHWQGAASHWHETGETRRRAGARLAKCHAAAGWEAVGAVQGFLSCGGEMVWQGRVTDTPDHAPTTRVHSAANPSRYRRSGRAHAGLTNGPGPGTRPDRGAAGNARRARVRAKTINTTHTTHPVTTTSQHHTIQPATGPRNEPKRPARGRLARDKAAWRTTPPRTSSGSAS